MGLRRCSLSGYTMAILIFLAFGINSDSVAERIPVTHEWPVRLQASPSETLSGEQRDCFGRGTSLFQEVSEGTPIGGASMVSFSSTSTGHESLSDTVSWGAQMKAHQTVQQQRRQPDFRACSSCGDSRVKQGISSAVMNGVWVAFFCKTCAPHLSVRHHGQVPVSLSQNRLSPAPIHGGNESLTMLPLYKRCFRCRRWATFGIPGPVRRVRHCKEHASPSDKDVVHKRLCQHKEGCKLRPVFGRRADRLPSFCRKHRLNTHVDIVHLRCRARLPNRQRCIQPPVFGHPSDSSPTRCWLHKESHHVTVPQQSNPADLSEPTTPDTTQESLLSSMPCTPRARRTRFALSDGPPFPFQHAPNFPAPPSLHLLDRREPPWELREHGTESPSTPKRGPNSGDPAGEVVSWFTRVQRLSRIPQAGVR
mmetsp:Transcript_12992/g.25942  ORF Transcript_12992/g.25942 Transcript_12992/m.25942 type:complete len:421 (+) Transcript_12992:267-1529(+)